MATVIPHTASTPLLGPEFDAFLFAPLGEDKKGMLVSVVSALARLNVDPWQEASALAKLQGEPATQRLAARIASFSDTFSGQFDPGKVAARLTKLLPRPTNPARLAPGTATSSGVMAGPKGMTFVIAANVIFFLLFLAAQSLLPASPPPGHSPSANAPALATSAPQLPLPTPGR